MTQIAQTRPAGGAANAVARHQAAALQAKRIDQAPSPEKAVQPTGTEDVPEHCRSGGRQHRAKSRAD